MRSVTTWLRPALAGLTTRGRSFLAAGVASAICSLLLGQRDLLRVGALLIALPIGCALVIGRARYRLALTRTITPARVIAGGTARVRLELENMTRLSTRILLAEDRVPFSLGASPRFVLARLPGGTRAAVTYSVRSVVRGRYPIGPVRLRLTDPFGMCEVTRSFTATDPLVVLPRTWPLAPARGGGLWAGTGESVSRSAAASGEDDIATREYRHGDDLRRVHWRSTARRGELMVRREEQPRQMRATIVLDNRADGHRGEGPESSLEWAVSVAASAAVSLAAEHYGVRLLRDDRPATWTSPYSGDSAVTLLDELAVAEHGGPHVLGGAISALGRSGGDGLVVAVLGEVEPDVAASLCRLVPRGSRGVAMLARTTAWAALTPARAAELDAARHRAMATLKEAGWAVADAGPADTVPLVWARALGLSGSLLPAGGSGANGTPRLPGTTGTSHLPGSYGVPHPPGSYATPGPPGNYGTPGPPGNYGTPGPYPGTGVPGPFPPAAPPHGHPATFPAPAHYPPAPYPAAYPAPPQGPPPPGGFAAPAAGPGGER